MLSCEDQKILEPTFPSLTKEEESKEEVQDEKTKQCLLEERIEQLEQEMWNKDAENASLKSQITRLNETVAEEQQKTCQEQWNLYYEQVKTQEEIEKNKLLQEELSKVKEELSNMTARTTVASEMNPMDCSSDSEVRDC